MQTPRQLTRIGVFYLEEAILDVLFEAKHNRNNPFVRLVEMRKTFGIYNQWTNDNWLVRSLLYKLEKNDNKVQQNRKGGAWQLTDAEYNRRKIGIEDEKPSSDDKHDGVVKGTKIHPSGGKESASSPEKPVQGTNIPPSKGC